MRTEAEPIAAPPRRPPDGPDSAWSPLFASTIIVAAESDRRRLPVRDLAARFLEAVAGTASPDTRTHIDHALLTLE
jgi:hypothetical protein